MANFLSDFSSLLGSDKLSRTFPDWANAQKDVTKNRQVNTTDFIVNYMDFVSDSIKFPAGEFLLSSDIQVERMHMRAAFIKIQAAMITNQKATRKYKWLSGKKRNPDQLIQLSSILHIA